MRKAVTQWRYLWAVGPGDLPVVSEVNDLRRCLVVGNNGAGGVSWRGFGNGAV